MREKFSFMFGIEMVSSENHFLIILSMKMRKIQSFIKAHSHMVKKALSFHFLSFTSIFFLRANFGAFSIKIIAIKKKEKLQFYRKEGRENLFMELRKKFYSKLI